MKLQYLGTAAAEGWPALFCECDHCRRARAAGGNNIRTRSQALLDDKLVIDFPADTYLHILKHGLNTSLWTGVIFTHAHPDHFYPEDLFLHRPPYSHGVGALQLYLTQSAAGKIKDRLSHSDEWADHLLFHVIEDFKPFYQDAYEITPLRADHDPSQDAHIYCISDGKKTLLYAHDTGYFTDDTWAYLKGRHFDLISLDCTYGALPTHRKGHMSIDVCAEVTQRLEEEKCIDGNTLRIINHFSHNSLKIYDEMVPFARQYGFDVSFDGKIIEF